MNKIQTNQDINWKINKNLNHDRKRVNGRWKRLISFPPPHISDPLPATDMVRLDLTTLMCRSPEVMLLSFFLGPLFQILYVVFCVLQPSRRSVHRWALLELLKLRLPLMKSWKSSRQQHAVAIPVHQHSSNENPLRWTRSSIKRQLYWRDRPL